MVCLITKYQNNRTMFREAAIMRDNTSKRIKHKYQSITFTVTLLILTLTLIIKTKKL